MDVIALIITILVVGLVVVPLAVGAAFFWISKTNQKHTLEVLDRFLSRNMSEYSMGDMVRREVEIDQNDDKSVDSEEDAMFEKFLSSDRGKEVARDLVG